MIKAQKAKLVYYRSLFYPCFIFNSRSIDVVQKNLQQTSDKVEKWDI